MTFQLDTTGIVLGETRANTSGGVQPDGAWTWGALDPFTQGYVEALLASFPRYIVGATYEPRGEGAGWEPAPSDDLATFFTVDEVDPQGSEGHAGSETRAQAQAMADQMSDDDGFGFSDLAPETLARIIADCAAFVKQYPGWDHRDGGRLFWASRQGGATGWPAYMSEGFPPLTVQLGADGKVRFA